MKEIVHKIMETFVLNKFPEIENINVSDSEIIYKTNCLCICYSVKSSDSFFDITKKTMSLLKMCEGKLISSDYFPNSKLIRVIALFDH
jgi:GTPase SAR1 family protein